MAQDQPKKNHIANLAAAIACFEPGIVNENGEREYRPNPDRKTPPTFNQLIGICASAIGEIYDFTQLHERLKKEHSHFLSERLACSVALSNIGLTNDDYESAVVYQNLEILIGRFTKALDILENICKSPDGETQTIARKFVLQFRPETFHDGGFGGTIIRLDGPVRTEQTSQADSEPDTIPPQP